MTNFNNGEINISNKIEIKPGFTFEQFKKTCFFNGQDGIRTIHLDGYHTIGDGRKYKIILFFKDSIIYMVSLICCEIEFRFDNESERKILHDKILNEYNIESLQYKWGKIQSNYDMLSNISSIDIIYN